MTGMTVPSKREPWYTSQYHISAERELPKVETPALSIPKNSRRRNQLSLYQQNHTSICMSSVQKEARGGGAMGRAHAKNMFSPKLMTRFWRSTAPDCSVGNVGRAQAVRASPTFRFDGCAVKLVLSLFRTFKTCCAVHWMEEAWAVPQRRRAGSLQS